MSRSMKQRCFKRVLFLESRGLFLEEMEQSGSDTMWLTIAVKLVVDERPSRRENWLDI